MLVPAPELKSLGTKVCCQVYERPSGKERAFRNKMLDGFLFCCSRLVGTVQKFSEAVAFI